MTNNKIIFWASDFSHKSGEGRLGRLFISKLQKFKKNNKITLIKSVFTKNNNNTNKLFFSSWIHKYFGPIYGIIKLWFFFFTRLENMLCELFTIMEFHNFFISATQNYFGTNHWKCIKRRKYFFKKNIRAN